MTEPRIRIYERLPDGTLEDRQQDFDLAFFAGQMPLVGDMIVVPGVPQGLDRHDYNNREVWTIVGRVFNPRDLEQYIALIVEERRPTAKEEAVVVG